MAVNSEIFDIRYAGDKFFGTTFDARELGTVLIGLQDLVDNVTRELYPDEADEIRIRFKEISEGSNWLTVIFPGIKGDMNQIALDKRIQHIAIGAAVLLAAGVIGPKIFDSLLKHNEVTQKQQMEYVLENKKEDNRHEEAMQQNAITASLSQVELRKLAEMQDRQKIRRATYKVIQPYESETGMTSSFTVEYGDFIQKADHEQIQHSLKRLSKNVELNEITTTIDHPRKLVSLRTADFDGRENWELTFTVNGKEIKKPVKVKDTNFLLFLVNEKPLLGKSDIIYADLKEIIHRKLDSKTKTEWQIARIHSVQRYDGNQETIYPVKIAVQNVPRLDK